MCLRNRDCGLCPFVHVSKFLVLFMVSSPEPAPPATPCALHRCGFPVGTLMRLDAVTLYHRVTGCTRSAPWFTLRHSGRVYFANIITGETRWAPPMGWRDGWVSHASPFDHRSPYARSLIPPSLATMHVEGGACYLESS